MLVGLAWFHAATCLSKARKFAASLEQGIFSSNKEEESGTMWELGLCLLYKGMFQAQSTHRQSWGEVTGYGIAASSAVHPDPHWDARKNKQIMSHLPGPMATLNMEVEKRLSDLRLIPASQSLPAQLRQHIRATARTLQGE